MRVMYMRVLCTDASLYMWSADMDFNVFNCRSCVCVSAVRMIPSSFLSLCGLSRRVCVLLYKTCVLRDHVGDAIDDGVGNAKLFIDQLVGLLVVPQWLFGQGTCEELEQRGVKQLVLGLIVLHIISKASVV